MDSEMVKGKPLSKDETKALLDLIEKSTIIISKTTNATNNKLKTQEWIRLTERFNATVTTCRRTPQQLRLKWENLKKNSRKRSTKIRMNLLKTGGGAPEYIPPDDILDRVMSLLGSTVSGFSVPFGGDKEPEVFFVGGGDGDESGDGGEGDGDGPIGGEAIVDRDSLPDIGVSNIHIVECEQLMTQTPKQKFTLNIPRGVKRKKKFASDEGKTARNNAIAEYYHTKKQCMDATLTNILLQNEKIKLEIEKLKNELKNA